MSSESAAYRRELELELERLTKELADIRVEKAQQRQRIEHLQVEQHQLKDQLASRSGDKSMRTDLSQQLQSLQTVVKQKKQEHGRVKQEWERSQEQYQHLKRTVGLLQGSVVSDLIEQQQQQQQQQQQGDDDHDENVLDGMPQVSSTSRDFLQSMWGSMGNTPVNENGNNLLNNLANEVVVSAASVPDDAESQAESLLWGGTEDASTLDGDNTTVVTEHTKDSLQVYRKQRAAAAAAAAAASTDEPRLNDRDERQRLVDQSDGSGGLGRFLSRERTRDTPATPGRVRGRSSDSSASSGGSLGDHFERERDKIQRSYRHILDGLDEEKGIPSSSE